MYIQVKIFFLVESWHRNRTLGSKAFEFSLCLGFMVSSIFCIGKHHGSSDALELGWKKWVEALNTAGVDYLRNKTKRSWPLIEWGSSMKLGKCSRVRFRVRNNSKSAQRRFGSGMAIFRFPSLWSVLPVTFPFWSVVLCTKQTSVYDALFCF